MAPVVTMRQLLESGVHFGHQTRRWNPKMKRFIFTERNGIYIIDLQQSLDYIDRAYDFIRETVAHGGSVLYVGTQKQAQEAIAEQARRVGMPFVNQRWLGGMLTNFGTVYKRLQRLKELEEIDFDEWPARTSPRRSFCSSGGSGTSSSARLAASATCPGCRAPCGSWTPARRSTSRSARHAKLGIPVIAILDTNCDPDEVQYPIPGNDDAIRSVSLLTRVIADAVADGLIARAGAAAGDDKPTAETPEGEIGAAEPLAEWERELLEGRPEAAAGTAQANGAARTRGSRGAGRAAETEAAAPSASEPSVTEASASELSVTEASASEPSVTEASTGEPSVTEASAGEPSVTEASAGEPSVTDASASELSVTDASASEPSTAEPSVTEPSATESTAAEPPAAEPTAAEDPTA